MDSFLFAPNKIPIIFLTLFALGGCATYKIAPDELATQLRENQKRSKWFAPAFATKEKTLLPLLTDLSIDQNGIKKIICINSQGEKVSLAIDNTTQLEIT